MQIADCTLDIGHCRARSREHRHSYIGAHPRTLSNTQPTHGTRDGRFRRFGENPAAHSSDARKSVRRQTGCWPPQRLIFAAIRRMRPKAPVSPEHGCSLAMPNDMHHRCNAHLCREQTSHFRPSHGDLLASCWAVCGRKRSSRPKSQSKENERERESDGIIRMQGFCRAPIVGTISGASSRGFRRASDGICQTIKRLPYLAAACVVV